MKKSLTTIILLFTLGASGCNVVIKSAADDKTANPVNVSPSVAAVNQNVDQAVNANVAPTPQTTKSANANSASINESLPRKIDKDTAESPIYPLKSANCKQEQATDDYYVRCKAYGDYILIGTGYDNINHYSIEPKNADAGFAIELMPLATGDAAKYQYNDKFVQKLGDKITWLLDDAGKPYALFVHASFYKATGGGKTFDNPKNKVAEFILLRGLSVSEEMDHDINAVGTAYNPDEWARKIAYEILEQRQK